MQLASIHVALQVCSDFAMLSRLQTEGMQAAHEAMPCILYCAALVCVRSHTLRCELQLLDLHVRREYPIEVHHQAQGLDAVRAPHHVQVSHLACSMCSRICPAGSCSTAAHTSDNIAGA